MRTKVLILAALVAVVAAQPVLAAPGGLGGQRLAIVNDNNFGGVGGRNPGLPDYTDFITVRAEALRGGV